MSADALAGLLRGTLLALGLLFVVVNARVGWEIVAWLRRRRQAVLVWPAPKPPFYAINLAIGVMLGLLLFVTLFGVRRPAASVFGVAMMFAYYGYLLPLSTRIARGLYADGIWTDGRFLRYVDMSGLSWKPGEAGTLIVVSRARAVAERLHVPGACLGEVRRLLREKIGSHAIALEEGPGIHLGTRDTRESV